MKRHDGNGPLLATLESGKLCASSSSHLLLSCITASVGASAGSGLAFPILKDFFQILYVHWTVGGDKQAEISRHAHA